MFWVVAFMTLASLPGLARIVVSAVENIGGVGRGVLGTTRIVGVACIVLAITTRYPSFRALGAPGFFFLATIALHGIIGTAVSTAKDPAFTFMWTQQYRLLGMLIVVATASGLADVASRIGLERTLRGVLAILTAVCVGVVASPLLVFADIAYGINEGRSIGVLSGPNHSAVYACMTFSLACSLITWRGKSALSIFAICVAYLAVMLTWSRLGVILLVSLTAVHVFYHAKKHGAAAVVLPGLSALAFCALVAWLVFIVRDEVWLRQSIARLASLNTGRLELWQHGWLMIKESPIIGHGIDTFRRFEDYSISSCRDSDGRRQACGVHAQHLLFWGEAGILPFTTFLLFFASVLSRCSWPPASLAKTIALAWTMCMAFYCLLFHEIFVQPSNYFIIGIICSLLSVGDMVDRPSRPLHTAKPLE